MRILIQTIVTLYLLAPHLVMAQATKDPLGYSLKTYGLILGMSLLGGFVSWYAKVRRGDLPGWSLMQLVGELCTSAFAGLVAFWLCEWANFPQLLTAPIVGVAGHMGTRGIQLLERIGEARARRLLGVEGGPQA